VIAEFRRGIIYLQHKNSNYLTPKKDEARLVAGSSPNKPKTKIMNQIFSSRLYNPVIHLLDLTLQKYITNFVPTVNEL